MSDVQETMTGQTMTGQAAAGPAMARETVDPRALRNALGQFATGVVVVTAAAFDGGPVGVTMSSFNSVSLDPPLVLFSVDRRAFSLPIMRAAKGFAINVLGTDQQAMSDRFARAGEDKWKDVAHAAGIHGAPVLTGALASFECVPYARHDGGDHELFLVRVVRFTVHAGKPLLFFGGRYRSLA